MDAKASIALAIEAAVAGLVALMATGDGELADASGLAAWSLGAGVLLLAASVVLSVLVVFPQLRGRATRGEYSNDVVYFGHLRLWEPQSLAARLAEDSGELDGLARQLVRMSKIAWRKHVWLQWSLALFVTGVLAVGGSFLSDRAASTPSGGEPTPSSSASQG